MVATVGTRTSFPSGAEAVPPTTAASRIKAETNEHDPVAVRPHAFEAPYERRRESHGHEGEGACRSPETHSIPALALPIGSRARSTSTRSPHQAMFRRSGPPQCTSRRGRAPHGTHTRTVRRSG